MSWIDGLTHRVRVLLDPQGHERELREEMGFHEELDTGQQGDLSVARRRFGNRTRYMEATRDETWLAWWDVLRQDALFAVRSLRRNRGVTVLVVVTLALGVGLNASVFSVLDRLYLRAPEGVRDPAQVQRIWVRHYRTESGVPWASPSMTFPMFRAIAMAAGDTTHFAASQGMGGFRLGGTRRGAKADPQFVTGNYFAVLGVRPFLGRFFTPDEAQWESGARVVVLSHAFWRTAFGADSGVVGRRILLDTTRFTVVGVAAEGFDGPDLQPVKVWLPMGAYDRPAWMRESLSVSHRMYIFRAIARFTPDMDVAPFERRATMAIRELSRTADGARADTLLTVQLGSVIEARGPGEQPAALTISTRLQAVSLIVLLIACANVVNLLLARAVRRRREIAVRLALGMSRSRLVRLLTTETVLLALIAGAVALLAAWWGGTALRAQLLPNIEWQTSTLHARVIVFTVAIAALCGLVAGVIPAVQHSRPRLSQALKDGDSRGGTARSRLRGALLVSQAALSVTLLVGAALFVRSLRNVQEVDIGYDAAQLFFGIAAFEPGQQPPDAVVGAAMERVAEILASRPGVEAVARSGNEPMRGISFNTFYWGNDSSSSLRGRYPVYGAVSSSFFRAAGIRLLRGSVFGDGAAGRYQVVVNDAMAKLLWPGQEAVGQCMHFGKPDAPCTRVTGVVETVSRDKVIEPASPQYYLALGTPETASWGGSVLVVRSAPDAQRAVRAEIAASLRRVLPGAEPIIHAMTENLDPEYRPWRLGAWLFTGVGVLALVVALVGIYSSVSYTVSQRTHEFGVRITLGARMADILRQVLDESLRVVLVGVIAGIALALAAGRFIAAMLFGVEPADPSVMLLVACSLIIAAGIAALVPAWRASRVDPAITLRAD